MGIEDIVRCWRRNLDLDLNLLRILDALLLERSVGRAAARLGMTTSGASRALGRLRRHFGDDLLVRDGRRMRPTPRALELAPAVTSILEDIGRLDTAGGFEPARDAWTVRIAGSDYFEHVVLPRLATTLATVAPAVRLFNVRTSAVRTGLVEGRLDFAVGPRGSMDDPALRSRRLCADQLVAVLHEDHPLVDRLTLDAYCAARHVLVAPGGEDGGVVDRLLRAQGLSRHVAVLTSTFASALPVVAATGAIAAFPVGLAEALVQRWPLVWRPLPLDVPPFVLMGYWPERLQSNAAHRWFRSAVFPD